MYVPVPAYGLRRIPGWPQAEQNRREKGTGKMTGKGRESGLGRGGARILDLGVM